MELILASASPRRQALLALLPYVFTVLPSEAEETIDPASSPEDNVRRLAQGKADAVAAAHPNAVVLGCDTVVAVGGEILGKPTDQADAARMLRTLSGREHAVYTGVCIAAPGERRVFCERTAVFFRPIGEDELAWYVGTGEPMDKAGAYGIQGRGALFVEGICGDYNNVVGLPVCRLYQELRAVMPRQGG